MEEVWEEELKVVELDYTEDDEERELSYRYLNKKFHESPHVEIKYGDYTIRGDIPEIKDFISFGLVSEINYLIDEQDPIIRWKLKFHISLPEENKGSEEGALSHYAKAWRIVRQILLNHRVGSFKIAKDDILVSETDGEAGKDITIYAFQDRSKDINAWFKIMQEISQELHEAAIPPGYRVQNPAKPEFQVEGSNYIYYRYEKFRLYVREEDPCASRKVTVVGVQEEPRTLVQPNDRRCCNCCGIN